MITLDEGRDAEPERLDGFDLDDGVPRTEDDDSDDDSVDEEFLSSDMLLFIQYVRRFARPIFRRAGSWQEVLANIDTVPSHIIAGIDMKALFAAAPEFAKWAIRFCLGQEHVAHVSLSEMAGFVRDEKAQQERVARKGRPHQVVREPMAGVVRALAARKSGCRSMYVRDNELSSWLHQNPGALRAWCNVFTVSKTTGLLRIICDSRAANALLINMVAMQLFTLRTVVDRFNACLFGMRHEKVFAMIADLRHEFHQLPLPAHLRCFFQINISDTVVYPVAWPMGVHAAPGIGHATTWALLLADLGRASNLGRALGIDPSWDPSAAPRWMPLTCGGAIFVLIDNIFIFTPDQRRAQAWRRRIIGSANKFRATLKHPEKTQHVPAGHVEGFIDNNDHAVNFVEIKRDSDATSIEFSGILFSGKGRRLSRDIAEVAQLEAENGAWTGSYREAASIMSHIMWFFRVHDRCLLDYEEFMSLYSSTHPKTGAGWGAKCDLTPEDTATLRRVYHEARKNGWTPFARLPENWIPRNIILAATDASGAKGGYGYGWMFQPRDQAGHGGTRPPIFGKGPHSFKRHIVLGELEAVLKLLQALERWCTLNNVAAPELILLAIDSMGAKGMLERGYSRNAKARQLLREIFALPGGRRIFAMYIDTKLNPTDQLSRNEIVNGLEYPPEKWDKTLQSLLAFESAAINCVSCLNGVVAGSPRPREI